MKNFSQPIAFSCRDGQTEERNERKKSLKVVIKKNSLDIFFSWTCAKRIVASKKNGNNVKGGRQKTKNVK